MRLWRGNGRQLVAALLAAGIFAVDSLTPSNVEFASLYVLVLLVAEDGERGLRLWIWTAASIVLATISFLYLFDTTDTPHNLERFSIAIGTIVCTTFLLVSRSRAEAALLDLRTQVRLQEDLARTRGELEHALRAASIGELTGSIAHEVNQPLSAVTGYATASLRWLRHNPPNVDEARTAIDQVLVAAQRASDVVMRVRKLIGKAEPEQIPIEIDPFVSEAARLHAGQATTRGVTICVDLNGPGAYANGDKLLLQQLLLNLIDNALQSMDEVPRNSRSLFISTRANTEHIVIDVEDTGPGFTKEARELAFHSFFTTKRRGMGLGLSICRTTAIAHQGSLEIETGARSQGALLRLTLPRGSLA